MKRAPTPPDPFRFGWRDVQQIGPDGSKQWVQVPLTLDDVLHPQEGDHIPESTQQELDRTYLATVLRSHLSNNPRMRVLSDCLINWGVCGLGNHSPDISVFEGVNEPRRRNWRTFRVAAEGAQPVLTIEIVSPDARDRQARDNDVVTKVREYYRAGVPLYIIVDQERVDGPRQLIGYRRGARRYLRMRPDRQGRLLLEPVRLWLGLRDELAVCWDADADKEIGDLTATTRALREAQARIRALESQLRHNGSQQ
ncbi:MAG TPA: Uma2 family endonuclease [Gemmataceae bacterium]|nr:Uma2 family endonuclease [Gemmataceae bacterium]